MTVRPPMFGYQVQQPAISNGLGTTALVLGIVGLVLFWVPGLGLILGALATTFGAIGFNKARTTRRPIRARLWPGSYWESSL